MYVYKEKIVTTFIKSNLNVNITLIWYYESNKYNIMNIIYDHNSQSQNLNKDR